MTHAEAQGLQARFAQAREADDAIVAEVRQTVRDLNGMPLRGQTHGLKDTTVEHVFRFRDGKVTRFDIQDAA